ncbi:hypothetical protein Q0590_02950 [Rhodocytophaga aerolata]|uniref:Uncharacterized protein n=1 Tax=Rhodocytophaga aerolata TaxID=455078 RepID=A0ABT8QZT4_9BACT|nr:hypothetical protein [Rhodocytophaga aerolata]MDO1445189.1 hypothetical protein [Rhodocytophaga aerolata]
MIILFIALSIVYDEIYTIGMISGTYVYNFPVAGAEGPSRGDQLTLKKNGQFESDTWGNGSFAIDGSALVLSYNDLPQEGSFQLEDSLVSYQYPGGDVSVTFPLYRPLFWGRPHISVFRDLNYYFQKID